MDGERTLIPCHFTIGCARRWRLRSSRRRAQLAQRMKHPLRKLGQRTLALRMPGLCWLSVDAVEQRVSFERGPAFLPLTCDLQCFGRSVARPPRVTDRRRAAGQVDEHVRADRIGYAPPDERPRFDPGILEMCELATASGGPCHVGPNQGAVNGGGEMLKRFQRERQRAFKVPKHGPAA